MGTVRGPRDAGMTLVELLITIVILGVISGAIGTAAIVFIKNERSSGDRLTASRYQQALNTWLPSDVQSADPTTFTAAATDPGNTTGCSGGPAFTGTNKLRLQLYAPPSGNATVVSYRLTGSGPYQLVRSWCSDTGAPQSILLVDSIAATGDVSVSPDPLTAGLATLQMSVTTTPSAAASAVTFRLRVSPRLPTAQTLAPTTTTGTSTTTSTSTTTTSTTTTSTTTTTLPCSLGSGLVSPSPVRRTGSGANKTANGTYAFTVTTNASCTGSMRLTFTSGNSITLTGGPPTWSGTLANGTAVGNWGPNSSGTATVTVERNVSGTWTSIGTFTVAVA